MFDLQVVIQLGLLIRGERTLLLALDELPNPLAGGLRRLEIENVAGTQRGNELNELFVRSHERIIASE